ncbi:hypothetical protein AN639_07310 [Candidatus Epulonipiscium fishelsonii]|uniref:Uncharacterized protein n=1 Tax=Candidatus Epulonipiscium fishelsonii TaxID=77094 RepID=A0ACC8XA30_9FIRM|nr:hypothetical protein AN639_07310 [Epulopiscium sp. SCG-B05WGA-EpuloA1]ONI39057.1 hypothetical protein AN396_09295 [Epulopiscium sp. SCG-B11WGA-EpuloA1]ONI47536.1 hypothetical protein AN644_04845 [Epulopiscium sp. SCG-C06WGA-EpuloA1]
MGEIVAFVVIGIILFGGCYFVNDTQKKHGTCCGKGCAGCPVFEQEITVNKNIGSSINKHNEIDENNR